MLFVSGKAMYPPFRHSMHNVCRQYHRHTMHVREAGVHHIAKFPAQTIRLPQKHPDHIFRLYSFYCRHRTSTVSVYLRRMLISPLLPRTAYSIIYQQYPVSIQSLYDRFGSSYSIAYKTHSSYPLKNVHQRTSYIFLQLVQNFLHNQSLMSESFPSSHNNLFQLDVILLQTYHHLS